MNEAIKLAIEKEGYQIEPLGGDFRGSNEYQMRAMRHEIEWRDKAIVLDPAFWQALGKALGWFRKPNKNTYRDGSKATHCGVEAKLQNNHWFCPHCDRYEWDVDFCEMWLYHWHRFIDHIANGKDVDEFFKDLLGETKT